ncbi:unnamed protein product [Acanthoscelides obtectus]|uniref:Uncharacterized protein n=1 Tax=Acanthoscelides obtectus TaxID=200917 RepID=A0A9P0Q5C7_ACAOB|nr:unnamed protein product [Acanthoscelides obtectus]CAK1640875.1 hypothetical protein AOBTE_LOCUS11989 [Acanthoscelides obtectus]
MNNRPSADRPKNLYSLTQLATGCPTVIECSFCDRNSATSNRVATGGIKVTYDGKQSSCL